ncbi:MAG: hypothetical protein CMJ42_22660 [Phyllobacteriaceae bacterium]|nr:hypothetical protein [Phyllobacteriaceae bacterium]MBA91940.1 hypothetical protein [Phyllobacteriaceae bacterium]
MKNVSLHTSAFRLAGIAIVCTGLAGCGTAAVVGVGATYAVTKAAVKTTVRTTTGAARLTGRGIAAAGRAVIPDGDDANDVND